jgi:hypothetical protein
VIKCTGGFVFGGYADVSWQSMTLYRGSRDGWPYRRSAQAFLFSLISPSSVVPVKLPLVHPNISYAIVCNASRGPTFGGGYDLYVANCANSNTCSSTNLGFTYQLPPGQSALTFFTGSQNFQAAGVEVYQVQLQ